MRSEKQKTVSPLSFSSFNECDQKFFQQFLQNYCLMVQKKEKANFDKQRKVNFFVGDQQQNNKCQSNIFNNNLSFPSINLFEFKEIQPFTGVGSLKQIDLKQILSFQQIKQEDVSEKCKIQHPNKTIENGTMIDENKNHQTKIISNLTKYQEPDFLGYSSRQARLRQILQFAGVIKEQLENALNYFTKNVSQ